MATTHGRTCLLVLAGLALAASAGCMGMTEQRQLTVLLAEYHGPAAGPSAQRLAKELTDQGLPDVFVVAGPDSSSLCAGHYPSWQDKNADAMLKRVRQIRDSQGQFPFAGVMLVPLPEAAPPSPWPLEKAKGAFTLHVASWEAPGRMAKAQAYAAELRLQGYEAYVFNGPRMSMVTLGSYGPEIFDNPAAVGTPGARPKIVGPQVLELIKRFPRMRLEGEITPPEAHVPTQIVRVPGRETAVAPGLPLPRVIYRVSLALVDTKTGMAEGRRVASGVAQSPAELTAVTALLVRQLMGDLPAGTARAGLAGVFPADEQAVRDRAAPIVAQAADEALRITAAGKANVVTQETTRQMLDAAGVKAEAALRDARLLKGIQGLDYVLTGSVTSFAR